MRKRNINFFIILLFILVRVASAGALEDALNEFKNLLYFIAAGVAALILAIHGIRLKLASSPTEREEAKKGIIYVILGLVLIILAVMIVSLIYRTPSSQPPATSTTTFLVTTHTGTITTIPGVTTTTFAGMTTTTTFTGIIECTETCINNGYLIWDCKFNCGPDEVDMNSKDCPSDKKCCCKLKPTTTFTTISTTKTSTTSTTTATSTTISTTTSTTLPYLTAKNLVDCINSKNGALYAEFANCPACRAQRRVFTDETSPPVGPGASEFNRLNILSPWSAPCNAIPCWSYNGKNQAGCKTMPQLNSFFGCNLIPYPGHSYIPCM